MKTQPIRLLAIVLACAASIPVAAFAQSTCGNTPRCSHAELKQLIRDAHTPEQYQALAAWFRSQEKLFADKATAEKAEWERRQAITTGPIIKSASADSARNLYQYYAYKADEMATRALSYERRSR